MVFLQEDCFQVRFLKSTKAPTNLKDIFKDIFNTDIKKFSWCCRDALKLEA